MPLRSGGGLGGVSGLESGLLIWVLCLLSGGFWAVKAGRFDLVLRAVGGVGSACGGVVGSCGRVVKSAAGGMVVSLNEVFILGAAYDVY